MIHDATPFILALLLIVAIVLVVNLLRFRRRIIELADRITAQRHSLRNEFSRDHRNQQEVVDAILKHLRLTPKIVHRHTELERES